MQTDRFDETIRQKLDSIQPAYHETAWQTLQRTLIQHGIASTGTAVGGILSILTGLTIAGLLGTTIYLYQSNQELHHQVESLAQTVTRLANQPQPWAQPSRIDTVYVLQPETTTLPSKTEPGASATQFDGVLSTENVLEQPQSKPTWPIVTQSANRPQPTDQPNESTRNPTNTGPSLTVPQVRLLAKQAKQVATQQSKPGLMPTERIAIKQPENESAAKTTIVDITEPVTAVGQTTAPANNRPPDPTTPEPASQPANTVLTKTGKITRPNRLSEPRLAATETKSDQTGTTALSGNSVRQASPFITRNSTATRQQNRLTRQRNQPANESVSLVSQPPVQPPSATISLIELANRPVQLQDMATSAGIDRRIRRLRYLFPFTGAPAPPVAAATSTPTAQPETRRVSLSPTVRLGLSGEADGLRIGGGLYVETRLNTHWTLGMGLNCITQSAGTYKTDEEFNESTRGDFRRDVGPGIDPRVIISNISLTRRIWQLPMSVGYRFPLKNGFALAPTVGLSVAIDVKEQLSFSFQRSPFEFGSTTVNAPLMPTGWFNNASLSVAAEKSWKHWTIQAIPFLSVPTQSSPNRFRGSPYQPNTTTGGLRLRLLYGF